ncbi:MAG: T9SS type A sorting domain-containing protein, partial [Candidatus Eisenbacteria bacterium]|nr:T9SS type A sorting domain-containing protein [Candidatus Eisenbacteria bacterium]
AATLADRSPTFLTQIMGATLIADAYSDVAGADGSDYCVRLETPLAGGEAYGTTNSHQPDGYEYDAWGNWCPEQFRFDVLGLTNDGVGNRAYQSLAGQETTYAQVVRESLPDDNYRVVLDGVSWHHLSERDGPADCVGDSAHIVTAVYHEIAAALEWVYDGPAEIPSDCYSYGVHTCITGADDSPGAVDTGVTRLYQNAPNPFNPRTLLRYTLAQAGPVTLTIFDVNGRRVRTLVKGSIDAGLHEVVWDGRDDAGHPLGSGVYWSQLEAGSYRTNKKMIALR